MPFRPLRVLILFDDDRGRGAAVIPRMKELLEHRAFVVDTHRIQDGPVDVSPYKGLIVGSPCFGFGIKGIGPTEALQRYVSALPDLDGVKAAVFCVYELGHGTTLDRMKGMMFEKGCDFVAAHAYSMLRPSRGEHILPTECMVRIR